MAFENQKSKSQREKDANAALPMSVLPGRKTSF
jgi:hypothetical protein